jgi:hypothetical protein
MGHSAPMLLNADRLPEILTARELEGLIRIDVKTIYPESAASGAMHSSS